MKWLYSPSRHHLHKEHAAHFLQARLKPLPCHSKLAHESLQRRKVCSKQTCAAAASEKLIETSQQDALKVLPKRLANNIVTTRPRKPLESGAQDLLDLIDVSAPYLALQNLRHNPDGTVTATVLPETALRKEHSVPISCSELGRHCAILGSLAAAAQNPVRRKHFYLAFSATLEVEASPDIRPISDSLEPTPLQLHAKVVNSRPGLTTCVVTAQLCNPDGKQQYATMKVRYGVVTAEKFQEQYPPSNELATYSTTHSLSASTASLAALSASTSRSNAQSPFQNPYWLTNISRKDDTTVVADLHFNDPDMAAGHFPGCPALPVAVLAGNAAQLPPYLDGCSEGIVYTALKVSCKRLVMFGETITYTCKRADENKFDVQVTDASGKVVASFSSTGYPCTTRT